MFFIEKLFLILVVYPIIVKFKSIYCEHILLQVDDIYSISILSRHSIILCDMCFPTLDDQEFVFNQSKKKFLMVCILLFQPHDSLDFDVVYCDLHNRNLLCKTCL